MAKINTERYKKLLLEERARLRAEASRISRRASSFDESGEIGDLADYDNHPADQGSETFERTKDLALDANLDDLLERIDDALRKIDDGTYGICDRCGRDINPERLRILPYATLCIDCQDLIEGR